VPALLFFFKKRVSLLHPCAACKGYQRCFPRPSPPCSRRAPRRTHSLAAHPPAGRCPQRCTPPPTLQQAGAPSQPTSCDQRPDEPKKKTLLPPPSVLAVKRYKSHPTAPTGARHRLDPRGTGPGRPRRPWLALFLEVHPPRGAPPVLAAGRLKNGDARAAQSHDAHSGQQRATVWHLKVIPHETLRIFFFFSKKKLGFHYASVPLGGRGRVLLGDSVGFVQRHFLAGRVNGCWVGRSVGFEAMTLIVSDIQVMHSRIFFFF
jgi:hypothetical protein